MTTRHRPSKPYMLRIPAADLAALRRQASREGMELAQWIRTVLYPRAGLPTELAQLPEGRPPGRRRRATTSSPARG